MTKGKIEVDRLEHKNVFHIDNVWRGYIVDPLEKELRRRFMYSKYKDHFCPECGRFMRFDIEKNHTFIAAVFICDECFDGKKTETTDYKWGYMI